jgi:hypothetical protein
VVILTFFETKRSLPSPASIGLFSLAREASLLSLKARELAFFESTLACFQRKHASERAKRTISCVDWSLTHLLRRFVFDPSPASIRL